MEFGNDILTDVANLRSVIHGLKMSGLGYVDQEAIPYIQDAIKKLPSPEQLQGISGDKRSIRNLAKQVGEILRLVEIYGKRGEEMKQRHKSLKQLPPRYKVLTWRKNMNTIKSGLIRSMVKISSVLDERGQENLSERVLVCAKNFRDEKIAANDFENLIREISAAGQDDLIKEANLLDRAMGWFGGAGDAAKGIGQKVKEIGQKYVSDPIKAGGYMAEFGGVARQIEKIYKNIQGLLNSNNPTVKNNVNYINQILVQVMNEWNKAAEAAKNLQNPEQQQGQQQGQQGQQQGQQGQQGTAGAQEQLANLVKQYPELLNKFPSLGDQEAWNK